MISRSEVAVILLLSLAQNSDSFASSTKNFRNAACWPNIDLTVSGGIKSPLLMTSSVHSSSLLIADDGELNGGTAVFMSTHQQGDDTQPPLRRRLRRATGFSLTACRKACRAATGLSASAIYATALAATSKYVRTFMTALISIFPPWFRYFLQPFLIMYYAPLLILRNFAGPTGRSARKSHEVLVESFKSAVDVAEKQADGYWPVHVTGTLSCVLICRCLPFVLI